MQAMKPPAERRDPKRVAIISLHTSPGDQPGTGDSGGMNVYVLSVARRLAEQGIAVDVFTRDRGDGAPEVERLGSGNRLIRVQAGPIAPVAKEDLPSLLPDFLGGMLTRAAIDDPADARKHSPYDVVHSHYWLSGWVGSRAKQIWGVPHVASFHTLGKVKNSVLAAGDRAEPPVRLAGEQRVVDRADRILAPTPAEADHLVDLYSADPHRIRIVPPGVDGRLFVPRPKERARMELGMAGRRVVLFVGRLQPLKGPDIVIRAMARAVRTSSHLTSDAMLALVGGPSGPAATGPELSRLRAIAESEGIGDRVRFFPAQPHHRLATMYSAAEALVMPSRTESFGLVAMEAQSCGTPVIAADVDGLRYVVRDGVTGFLVRGQEPQRYARRILDILGEPRMAERMSEAAVHRAARFSWESTVEDVRDVYRELAGSSLR
jgi:D-inositol-3-phosphate glycosyltransferase